MTQPVSRSGWTTQLQLLQMFATAGFLLHPSLGEALPDDHALTPWGGNGLRSLLAEVQQCAAQAPELSVGPD